MLTEANDELLSYTEAAALLKMPIGSLYGLVSKKQIPHVRISRRIVRFSRSELIAFLEGHRVELGAQPNETR